MIFDQLSDDDVLWYCPLSQDVAVDLERLLQSPRVFIGEKSTTIKLDGSIVVQFEYPRKNVGSGYRTFGFNRTNAISVYCPPISPFSPGPWAVPSATVNISLVKEVNLGFCHFDGVDQKRISISDLVQAILDPMSLLQWLNAQNHDVHWFSLPDKEDIKVSFELSERFTFFFECYPNSMKKMHSEQMQCSKASGTYTQTGPNTYVLTIDSTRQILWEQPEK